MADDEVEAQDEFKLPIVWTDGEEMPIFFANQFLAQWQKGGEFILWLGQMSPPVLLGSPEQRRAQAERLQWINVKTMCRVGFTRQRMQELIGVLQGSIEAHDRDAAEQDGGIT